MSKYDHTGATEGELQLLAAEARRKGISTTELRMQQVMQRPGGDVVQDIVGDNVGRWKPSEPRRPEQPIQRGTGWRDAPAIQPPPGISVIDAMCIADSERQRLAAQPQAGALET
jgi:hypothetical protein